MTRCKRSGRDITEGLDAYIEFANETKRFSDAGFYEDIKLCISTLEAELKGREWISGLPKEVGEYWLYSYRYGKEGSVGRDNEKEMMFVKVVRISNGTMLIGDGQSVYESEVEEPFYQKAFAPSPPITDKES